MNQQIIIVDVAVPQKDRIGGSCGSINRRQSHHGGLQAALQSEIWDSILLKLHADIKHSTVCAFWLESKMHTTLERGLKSIDAIVFSNYNKYRICILASSVGKLFRSLHADRTGSSHCIYSFRIFIKITSIFAKVPCLELRLGSIKLMRRR